jgi:hypothetical protein
LELKIEALEEEIRHSKGKIDQYEKDIYESACYIPFFTAILFGTVPYDELIDKDFPYNFIEFLSNE